MSHEGQGQTGRNQNVGIVIGVVLRNCLSNLSIKNKVIVILIKFNFFTMLVNEGHTCLEKSAG